jgi:antibiotic biosynthesis monooxygenase
MNAYRSVRVWQLKIGASAHELEELVTSGVLEMQRWIPGVKGLSLIRLDKESYGRYLMITTFTDYEAYQRWRQIEEEGSDYWERYASIMMHWEELAKLLEEYHGEVVSDFAVQYL